MKRFAYILMGVALCIAAQHVEWPKAFAQADITNLYAITVCNEVVRPLAEQQRDLYLRCKALMAQYPTSELNAMFPADGGAILDLRETASDLVSNDARRNLFFANDYITVYENAGVADMMRPCRPGGDDN